MKAWILAAVVAGVLVLVGVPALALTAASHDDGGKSGMSQAKPHPGKGPGAHHRMWKHGQHWGGRPLGPPPGWRHAPGHRPFSLDKLTPMQRAALADRLDKRATMLRKAATCLRQKGDATACLKRTFKQELKRGSLSHPPRRG